MSTRRGNRTERHARVGGGAADPPRQENQRARNTGTGHFASNVLVTPPKIASTKR